MTTPDDNRERTRSSTGAGAHTEPTSAPSPVRVFTLAHADLGNRSYVVDVGAGAAIAVDVPRSIHGALSVAAREGLRIVAAVDTHLHGDFVSGARELAAAAGTTVIAPADAGVEFPHRAVGDGSVILVGDVDVHTYATPGHGPEHVVYVVCVDNNPVAVFAGGALAGEITGDDPADDPDDDRADGEPGVPSEPPNRARTNAAWRRLAALGPATPLYLTHPDSTGSWPSTVAEFATAAQARDDTTTTSARARELAAVRAVNRRGPRLLDLLPAPQPLPATDVASRVRAGAWLVDARPPSAWHAGHAPLALSVAAGPSFRSRLAAVVPPGAPVVLVTDATGDRPDHLVTEARTCGHDGVVGWIDGGWPAWVRAGLPVVASARNASDPARREPTVIDVRSNPETIDLRPGARVVALDALAAGDVAVSPSDTVVVRADDAAAAATAASVLETRGVRATVATE